METTDLKIDIVNIENIEVLKEGKWNGQNVTKDDMDEMIANFKAGVLEPYLNLDHDDKFTDNVKKALSVISLGFVSNLKRVGGTLIANIKEVPRKVADLIESGMLKKRSVEFWPKGFRTGGKAYNNVFKAISFFGADVPAVNGLSNDFDILLKSKPNQNTAMLADKENDNPVKLNIEYNEDKKTMDKIEIDKTEYQTLLSLKSENARLATLKNDLEKVQTELDTTKVEVVTLKALEVEYNEFKAGVEKENETKIDAEATEFISKMINEGKLLPKYKDDKKADYIEKSKDETKLASFKEDMISRNKVIDLGPLENENTNGETNEDPTKMTNDELEDAIQVKMKAKGIDWTEAAKTFGVEA